MTFRRMFCRQATNCLAGATRFGRTDSWTTRWACCISLILVACIASARADINEWEWINPSNPGLGKRKSATPCPDGIGVSAVPGATLESLDLTQAYLIGANLQSASLGGTYLYNADLTNANLGNAGLIYTNFSSTTLTNANFTGASVAEATFSDSNLSAAQLSTAATDMHNIVFVNNELAGVNLAGRDLSLAYADASSLDNANLSNANLRWAAFYGCTLNHAIVTGADLSHAYFEQTNLSGIDFCSASVTETSFFQSDLTGTSFSGCDLTATRFDESDLTNASFAGATLTDVRLSYSIVLGANFSSSGLTPDQLASTASAQNLDLHDVNLSNNDLAYCDLTSQDLTGAVMQNTNLTNADFAGATLTNADLSGTDIRGANTDASLDGAITHNTIRPDGSIDGLTLAAGESLTVRNYSGTTTFIPITVNDEMSVNTTASLKFILDDQPWGSTISCDPGILVTLAGEMRLLFAQGVNPADLRGETFRLFDWTGVIPTGEFTVVGDSRWDTSQLYTTGEITFVPEPSAFVLLGIGSLGVFVDIGRRRRRSVA